jgi:hypothetical protein
MTTAFASGSPSSLTVPDTDATLESPQPKTDVKTTPRRIRE